MIITGIILFLIGGFCSFIIFNPKRIKIIKENEFFIKSNLALEQRNSELQKQKYDLNTEIITL